MAKITVNLQIRTKHCYIPHKRTFAQCAELVFAKQKSDCGINIRIVDIAEITTLNRDYRKKDAATNVLTFPLELPPDVHVPLLGDIVLCAPVINQEAQEQNITAKAHWMHIAIHGMLHLLGYDHIKKEDALIMENLEINILQQLDIANPYDI